MIDSIAIPNYRSVASIIREPRYRLSLDRARFFWENGYLGPLTCEASEVSDLPYLISEAGLTNLSNLQPVPKLTEWRDSKVKNINIHDPHLDIAQVRAIASHPSIVNPLAQLLGSQEIKFFKSRFRVKFPENGAPEPWHQDVGPNNGGCYEDGSPIPTLTVWLGIDGSTEASGSAKVMPGTHQQLLGDWRLGFHAKLADNGLLNDIDFSQAVPLEAKPSEFYIFHSWILHNSATNTSSLPRTGLVIRFVAAKDALNPKLDYISCLAR